MKAIVGVGAGSLGGGRWQCDLETNDQMRSPKVVASEPSNSVEQRESSAATRCGGR
jgi:hypothetical protein